MPKVNRVMIVDNSEMDIKVIKAILKDLPIETHAYTDPESALENLSNIAPEVIFLNYFMPEMTGATFMIKMSERLLTQSNWQVFLITGKKFSDDEKISMKTLGIAEIFEKPLNESLILDAIEKINSL